MLSYQNYEKTKNMIIENIQQLITFKKVLISIISFALLGIFGCANSNVDTNKYKYLGQKVPELTPILFAPNIVSTENYNERDLTISPDGNQLFFSRTKTSNHDDYDYDIMYSELENGIWSEPKIAWFSSKYGEVEAFFTPDGKELFFNSNRPASGKGDTEHWETWVMKKDGDNWTAPKLLGPPFNRVAHTTFTQTGKMYYVRDDLLALYMVSYKNGIFGQPEKLDTIINFSKVQYNCFISPDESYLIFGSRSKNYGFGNGDLYVSFRNAMNEWCKPINMGSEINSAGRETCPNVSNDGKYLFFTSNKGGNNDVYWISIKFIENLKALNTKSQ